MNPESQTPKIEKTEPMKQEGVAAKSEDKSNNTLMLSVGMFVLALAILVVLLIISKNNNINLFPSGNTASSIATSVATKTCDVPGLKFRISVPTSWACSGAGDGAAYKVSGEGYEMTWKLDGTDACLDKHPPKGCRLDSFMATSVVKAYFISEGTKSYRVRGEMLFPYVTNGDTKSYAYFSMTYPNAATGAATDVQKTLMKQIITSIKQI